MGRVEHNQPVVHPHQPTRTIHIGDKLFHLVSRAIPIGIAQPENPATMGLAVERAIAVAGNKERAVDCRRHEDRIAGEVGPGEDRCRKSLGGLHIAKQIGRRGPRSLIGHSAGTVAPASQQQAEQHHCVQPARKKLGFAAKKSDPGERPEGHGEVLQEEPGPHERVPHREGLLCGIRWAKSSATAGPVCHSSVPRRVSHAGPERPTSRLTPPAGWRGGGSVRCRRPRAAGWDRRQAAAPPDRPAAPPLPECQRRFRGACAPRRQRQAA